MRVVRLHEIRPEPERYPGKSNRLLHPVASLDHVEHVLEPDCKIVGPEGELLGFYVSFPQAERVRHAVAEVPYAKGARTEGTITQSAIFGHFPRNAIRQDFCHVAGMANSHPTVHRMLCELAQPISRTFKRLLPSEYEFQRGVVRDSIHPAYHMGNSPFTSGIANRDNPPHYHLDAGNFPNSWNCMVVLRRRCTGGETVFPQLNAAITSADCTLAIFQAAKWWHGVTPLQLFSGGHRYSLVYYALQALRHGLSPKEEIRRARKKRTERERKKRDKERLRG